MNREDAKEIVADALAAEGVGEFSATVIAARIVDALGLV